MGTDKRARQKANRARKIEQEHQVEKRSQRLRYLVTAVLVLVGVAAGAVLINLTGGDDDAGTAADDTTATSGDDSATDDTTDEDGGDSTSGDDEPAGETGAVVAPEPGASIDGTPPCPAEDGSDERTTSFTEAPPTCIDEAASYTATVETTLGAFTVELDAAAAPLTVNNFVFLARYHYYDGSPFHRIIPGFVIQGGDAVGEPLGTGNPGYLIEEEPPAEAYQVGSLAMAKGPSPSSTGSQFFIVTGEQGAALPGEYSLFGQVTEGMDVVEAIEALPTDPGDYPTEEIYIESVSITES